MVSETLEVGEVRGQSPGRVWAEWQEEMKLEPSAEEEVWLITERGKGPPAQAESQVCLAWKIPWMEEPGRLQSMWSLRVGHD